VVVAAVEVSVSSSAGALYHATAAATATTIKTMPHMIDANLPNRQL